MWVEFLDLLHSVTDRNVQLCVHLCVCQDFNIIYMLNTVLPDPLIYENLIRMNVF